MAGALVAAWTRAQSSGRRAWRPAGREDVTQKRPTPSQTKAREQISLKPDVCDDKTLYHGQQWDIPWA
jgi:hypothetical protein